MKTLLAAIVRVCVVAGILLGMVCCPPTVYGYVPRIAAKYDATNIAHALQVFKDRNGHYPQSLEELAQRQPDGGVALLTKRALRDPWGQPFHFDPGQLDPETGHPLVWSDGEPGKPDGKITNWGQEEAPPWYWAVAHTIAICMPMVVPVLAGLAMVRFTCFKEPPVLGWRSKLARGGIDILIFLFCCLFFVGCFLLLAHADSSDG
jgi:hypothetical protein